VLDADLQPPEKKRRLTKILSATSSDEENKTLTEIVQHYPEAAAAGRIYSIAKTNSYTLHFWANAVATALAKTADEKNDTAFSAVREFFGKLLTKLLLNSDCYEHLSQFEQLYNTLEEKGVQFPALAVPLRKLMLYKIDKDTSLGVEDMDLNTQRRFFTSELWKQFEQRRTACLLRQAKDEEHGEKRDSILKMWEAVPKNQCSLRR
jgi:hypothetical protein